MRSFLAFPRLNRLLLPADPSLPRGPRPASMVLPPRSGSAVVEVKGFFDPVLDGGQARASGDDLHVLLRGPDRARQWYASLLLPFSSPASHPSLNLMHAPIFLHVREETRSGFVKEGAGHEEDPAGIRSSMAAYEEHRRFSFVTCSTGSGESLHFSSFG